MVQCKCNQETCDACRERMFEGKFIEFDNEVTTHVQRGAKTGETLAFDVNFLHGVAMRYRDLQVLVKELERKRERGQREIDRQIEYRQIADSIYAKVISVLVGGDKEEW